MPATARAMSVALVAAAVCGLGVVACGTGEQTSRAHTSIARTRAHSVASAINLRREDFPRSAKAVPQPLTSNELHEGRVEERRCYGRNFVEWADVRSDAFVELTGHGTRVTTSQVIVRHSAPEAQSVLARSRNHRTQTCLARELRRALAHTPFRDLGGAYPSVGHMSVSALPITVPRSDGSAAWRYTTALAAAGRRFRQYEDLVVFVYGQDEVYLVAAGYSRPYPPDKERSLAAFLLERARMHTG